MMRMPIIGEGPCRVVDAILRCGAKKRREARSRDSLAGCDRPIGAGPPTRRL